MTATTLLLASALALMPAAPDLTGAWSIDLDPDFSGHQATGDCTFKQSGTKLTGTCGSDSPAPTALTGEVDGTTVVYRFQTGAKNEITATFTAELDAPARTMSGSWRFVEDGQARTGKFRATKR